MPGFGAERQRPGQAALDVGRREDAAVEEEPHRPSGEQAVNAALVGHRPQAPPATAPRSAASSRRPTARSTESIRPRTPAAPSSSTAAAAAGSPTATRVSNSARTGATASVSTRRTLP